MGYEVTCKATLGKQSAEGTAQLETDFLQFRSELFKFKISFKDLEVHASGADLQLKFDGKRAALHLDQKTAGKWADKILNPPSRLDKLGVKQGTTVCLEGAFDPAFAHELPASTGLANADLVFLAAQSKDQLAKAASIAKRMRPDAGLWIVYPKGRQEIREIDVLEAGRAASLKDIKVMRFSDTETALKFVVPVEDRKPRKRA